jgi:hypothetical protein
MYKMHTIHKCQIKINTTKCQKWYHYAQFSLSFKRFFPYVSHFEISILFVFSVFRGMDIFVWSLSFPSIWLNKNSPFQNTVRDKLTKKIKHKHICRWFSQIKILFTVIGFLFGTVFPFLTHSSQTGRTIRWVFNDSLTTPSL